MCEFYEEAFASIRTVDSDDESQKKADEVDDKTINQPIRCGKPNCQHGFPRPCMAPCALQPYHTGPCDCCSAKAHAAQVGQANAFCQWNESPTEYDFNAKTQTKVETVDSSDEEKFERPAKTTRIDTATTSKPCGKDDEKKPQPGKQIDIDGKEFSGLPAIPSMCRLLTGREPRSAAYFHESWAKFQAEFGSQAAASSIDREHSPDTNLVEVAPIDSQQHEDSQQQDSQ